MDDAAQILRAGALRPVDWRHRAADDLVREGRFPSQGTFGPRIKTIAEFLRTRLQDRDVDWQFSSGAPDPLQVAYELREAHSRHYAHAIEAAVLADLSCKEIDEFLGLPANSAEWYEAAFFDVRDRLTARGLIVHDVIRGCHEQRPDDFTNWGWKQVAYLVSADALFAVMGCNPVRELGALPSSLRVETLHLLEAKLRAVAHRVSANDVNGVGCALEILKSQTGDVFVPNEYESNVAAMLGEIKWQMRGKEPDWLKEYTAAGIELRAEQLNCLAGGGTLENAAELKAKRLPPPRSHHSGDTP